MVVKIEPYHIGVRGKYTPGYNRLIRKPDGTYRLIYPLIRDIDGEVYHCVEVLDNISDVFISEGYLRNNRFNHIIYFGDITSIMVNDDGTQTYLVQHGYHEIGYSCRC